METYNKDIFDLLSTYYRSTTGSVYYLLRGKTTQYLYVQMVNHGSGNMADPQYVGKPRENTTYSFENYERHRELGNGTLVIVGSSNTADKDTHRFYTTFIGGPWQEQEVFREV